jgi:uncharacterized membrane protein YjjP (DUF1212 family)
MTADSPVADHDPVEVLGMLRELGIALLETGQATNVVESTLADVGRAYGLHDLESIVLPTALIVKANGAATELAQSTLLGSRLDQAGAIDALGQEASLGTLAPSDAVARIREIRLSPPRFGRLPTLAGTALLTLGFGLLINPTLAALPAYLVLGVGVGLLILLSSRLPTLANVVPVLAAFLVSVATMLFLADAVGDDALHVIAPALVSFFPGLTLTVAAMELTSNQVIAGSSRLVYGIAQLLLIAFGVLAATIVTGRVPASGTHDTLGWWAGILGVLLVGVGYMLQQSAPPKSLPWIVVALFVAYGAQVVVAATVSPELSGFAAALVVVPFAHFASRFQSAPPARVMTLATFWLLVPGALGFIGVNEATSNQGGLQTLVSTGVSVLAIALGIIVGTGLTRDAVRIGSSLRKGRRHG